MDPVTAIITLLPLVITSVEQIDLLIKRMQDHRRTLLDAEEDRRAAGDALFPPTAAEMAAREARANATAALQAGPPTGTANV